jgi:hypothetical protein
VKKILPQKLPTSGRIGRLAKMIVSEVGLPVARQIMEGVDGFEHLDSPAKAEYMKQMVRRMKRLIGVGKTYKILVSCGQMCCGATARKRARTAMQASKSLKDFINRLNVQHIGGGRLKLKDDNTITGGYDKCYCGMVSKTVLPFPDLTYCHCSVGWYTQLFETALERPVKIKIRQSIICGAKTCEFEIKIGHKKSR